MFNNRAVNHKIEIIGLSALLNDETYTLNDMLSKSNDTAIHVKIIQILFLQISLQSFGSHNERHFYSLSITFEIVE